MTPILLLEINEVPWRLLDRYLGRSQFPHITQFFEHASHYTTLAVDTGELSPWVTWPTLHRGINNEQHGVRNLGQDPQTFIGKPIWQEIRERGGSIGICGSMQSWPPSDPGEGGFYIPDTFACDERCIPSYLAPLQSFNLALVRRNARTVSRALPNASDIMKVAASFWQSGIRIRTGARIGIQLLRERLDPALTARRPIFQAVLFWDVFRKHFKPDRPPRLTTFFTNHVASTMHRYWKDVFPEDFANQTSEKERSHEWVMRFAFRVLDDMLRDVLRWSAANPELVVIFASSMGQAAIHRGYHEGVELVVEDLALLMTRAGLRREEYTPLLAMAPQVAVKIEDESTRRRARSILESTYCGDGHKFIKVHEIGSSLSITVGTPPLKDIANGGFHIASKHVSWADAGIRKQDIEPGTGYHIPEGTLAVLCGQLQSASLNQSRSRVRTDRLKDWMLTISSDGPAKAAALASFAD